MPMTESEFNAFCDEHELSKAARTFINRVRAKGPARRVGGGSQNVACRFASRKMGFTIQAESQNPELAFVLSLEYDDDVLEYYDQCEVLQVRKQDRNGKFAHRPYTPDYIVFSRSEGVVIYECKRTEQVNRLLEDDKNWWQDEDGKAHFKPLEEWCMEIGIHARVMLSSSLSAKRIQNLQMLADYYRDDVPTIDDQARDRIISAFDEQRWATARHLISLNSQIKIDDIYWMIAHEELWIDFDRQVLADDMRTWIFRDRMALQAYQAMDATRTDSDPFQVTAVSLETGSHVQWDGNPFVVVNCGETTLYLQDSSSKMQELSIDAANRLISTGKLQNAAACDNPIALAAEEKMRTSSPRDLEEGMKRLNKMQLGLEGGQVPKRTLARLQAQYRLGIQKYGSGYLGLVTSTNKRGNRNRKLHRDVITEMERIAEEMILVPDPKSTAECLGELELRCQENGLHPPSERTFLTFKRSLRMEDITRAQRGNKAAHQFEPWHVSLSYETPRHGQRPFEFGHIDHTELGLHLVDETYRHQSIRAWLSVLIDAYSRKILAWHVSFEKPSRRAVMMVIRNCLERYGRGCDYYVVDQGSEFNGTDFETLLARLEAHKKERPAGKPRFGNVIERFFGVSEQEFISHLQANNLFLKNPRGMSKSHDPTKRAVWTLREFIDAWGNWLEEYYHKKEHGTLGVSPNLAFEEGLRRFGHRMHRRFAFNVGLKLLCMPNVDTPDGCLRINADLGLVKVHGVHYHDNILRSGKLHRHRVPTRYDPYDISHLHVFINGRWHELRCEFASDLEGISVHELQIFTEELKAKHSASYVRRMKNRSLLALFMRTTKATEDVLNKARTQAKESAEHPLQVRKNSSSESGNQRRNGNTTKPPKFDVNAHWGIKTTTNKEPNEHK